MLNNWCAIRCMQLTKKIMLYKLSGLFVKKNCFNFFLNANSDPFNLHLKEEKKTKEISNRMKMGETRNMRIKSTFMFLCYNSCGKA